MSYNTHFVSPQVHTEQEYFEKAARECRDNTRAKVELHGELSRPVLDSLHSLSEYFGWELMGEGGFGSRPQ